MTSAAIQFQDFSFKYKEATEPALRNITFQVEPGEILLVMGRSGCGKSTLALALNGAVPHLIEGEATGDLVVAGLSTLRHSVPEMTHHVGMVFQDPEVQLFALTVEDEVAMSLESYGVPRQEMRERVTWAMTVCGLTGMELNAPAKLSGGQKQRVAIAAVLARDTDVLAFDEPTGNLDPVGSRAVYETIRRICDDRGRTIVIVEHDLAPVIDLVHRVVVLEDGQVAAQGEPRDMLRATDLLRRSGVKVPIATQFGLRLQERRFVSYPRTPITLEEAIAPVRSRRGHKQAPSRPPTTPAPAAQGQPVIEFQNVSHQYDTGQKALDGINLRLYPGEFVAICGMNGAGKTTLALHVMGLLKPGAGKVIVAGQDTRTRTVAEMARTVGLIFQNPNHQLFKDTVAGELAFGPANIGWDAARIAAETKRVMALVGLSGLDQADPESLSIGQKQRVAVASVLVMQPQILLLDEPTTGQDQRTLEPFMELVAELNRQGMTVLMITHDMDVALRYASRLVVMGGGHILADGPPAEIFLREEVLTEARLHLPEILALSKHLNGEAPVFLTTLEELEAWVGLPSTAPV